MSKEYFNESFANELELSFGLQSLDANLEARILNDENIAAELPSLSFAAAAEYSRDGQDLVLKVGEQTVVVKDYFAQANPPTLKTMDGAVISPQMVDAFMQNDDEQEYYAASLLDRLLGNSGKSVGKDAVAIIENMEGTVLVIRNGKAISLQNNDSLLQGDQISTSGDGKLEIVFADGTHFQLGGDARISIDEFSFDAANSTGLQVLSILRGAFSYASGLVAKDDPSNVQLHTPVGEIGIRGTKIVGEIDPETATASITVLEGRVVYQNPDGEQFELDQGLDTVRISNGGEKVREISISPERVAREYDVFDSPQEVSDFVQQPEQEVNSDQPAENNGAEAELPDISYDQAQSEVRDLAIANANIALEGNTGNAEVAAQIIDAVANIALQRAEELQERYGKDQTQDRSLEATVHVLGGNNNNNDDPDPDPSYNSGSGSGQDDIFNIVLANLAGRVWGSLAEGGRATGDVLNLVLPSGVRADDIEITFARGVYDDGGGGRNTEQVFYYQENGEKKEFTFSNGDFLSNSVIQNLVETPNLGDLSDLLLTITFGEDQAFSIIFKDYFPKGSTQEPPAYSISIGGGEIKDFTDYPELIALLA